MPYDELLAERIKNSLQKLGVEFTSKDMMGGHVFQVDDKMLCGIHIDRKYGDSLVMARIGEEAYEKEIGKPECLPMDFTGRLMKGYVFVTPDGMKNDKQLEYWLQRALDFNPLAKASKKKVKR